MTTTADTGRNSRMASRPHFLQGIYSFQGRGLDQPFLLHPDLTYRVPRDTEAQFLDPRGRMALERASGCVEVRSVLVNMRRFGTRPGTRCAVNEP